MDSVCSVGQRCPFLLEEAHISSALVHIQLQPDVHVSLHGKAAPGYSFKRSWGPLAAGSGIVCSRDRALC